MIYQSKKRRENQSAADDFKKEAAYLKNHFMSINMVQYRFNYTVCKK